MKKFNTLFALLLLCISLSSCPQTPNPITNNELTAEDKAVILKDLMIASYTAYTSEYPDPVPGNPSGTLDYIVDVGTTPPTINFTFTDFYITDKNILYLISGTASLQTITYPVGVDYQRDMQFSGNLQISAANGMSCGIFSLSFTRIEYADSTYTETMTGSFAGTDIDYSASGTSGG